MSQAAANPALVLSREGQANGGGSVLALFRDVLLGEVITAFETQVVLAGLTRQRQISYGKSATFDAVYIAATEYFTAGNEITGGQILHNQITIPVDDIIIAPVMVFNLDEAMNHYDVRAPYAQELARAHARSLDKNIARNLMRAARASALFTGDTGGQSLTNANYRTVATTLAAGLFSAKQKLEEANVPVDTVPVKAAVLPAQWYLLAQEPTLVLNRFVGGAGSYSQGTLPLIGGVEVVKSNALPWGVDDSANSAIPAAYRVNMTNTAAAVFTEAAVGTVRLMGLTMESEPSVAKQGILMVAKQAVGHGPILPKCAVELKVA